MALEDMQDMWEKFDIATPQNTDVLIHSMFLNASHAKLSLWPTLKVTNNIVQSFTQLGRDTCSHLSH